MILKTIIIDDEPLAQEIIKKFAQDVKSLQIIGVYSDALEAMEIINNQIIDLIFLDINMPKLSGIEFLRTLKNPPNVILTTAYSDYALEGYELNVTDFLVKPFSFIRFLKAVQKVEHQYTQVQKPEIELTQESIFIKSNKKIYQLKFSEIIFIEGLGDYIKIYTEKSHLVTNLSMKKMEDLLPGNDFYRIHKSFIVSLKKIISIEGNMIEVQGKKLTIGNSYRTEFFNRINNLSAQNQN